MITDLLLGQQEPTGGLQLADFWLRRAHLIAQTLAAAFPDQAGGDDTGGPPSCLVR